MAFLKASQQIATFKTTNFEIVYETDKIHRKTDSWHSSSAGERNEGGGYLPGKRYQPGHVLSMAEEVRRDGCP